MWEHLSVLTFWKEAFKKCKRWMKQPLPGSPNYVPGERHFYNHQRSPQQSFAEPWQVSSEQQDILHFPLQFAKGRLILLNVYRWQLAQFTYMQFPWVKRGRSTHITKYKLSLHFLYEFTVQIVVHVEDHTLKLEQDGSSKAGKIYISVWKKQTNQGLSLETIHLL